MLVFMALFRLHHEKALNLFLRTQHKLLTTMVLTNCPKGKRKARLKVS